MSSAASSVPPIDNADALANSTTTQNTPGSSAEPTRTHREETLIESQLRVLEEQLTETRIENQRLRLKLQQQRLTTSESPAYRPTPRSVSFQVEGSSLHPTVEETPAPESDKGKSKA